MEKVKKLTLNNESALGGGQSTSPPTPSPRIVGAVASTASEPIPTMHRVTPHVGHRESMAMATSVGNSSVSPLADLHLGSSFSSSFSLPPSPGASLGVQVPPALQGLSRRPLFLSHSLSRDGDAMKRMEDEEERKKQQQQYEFNQDTKDSGPLGEKSKKTFSAHVMGMSPMGEAFGLPGSSPGGGRRETAHTMQRRKSSNLPSSSMTTSGGEKGGGEALHSFNTPLTSLPSDEHPLHLAIGMKKSCTGNERETHQDPQYALGTPSSSAPGCVLGVGKPFGASPRTRDGSPAATPFMNSNDAEGRLSGGEARIGGMILGDASHPVELPMRLRRGPGLSTSPSALSGDSGSGGGAGSNIPFPLALSGSNNLKRVDGVWGTSEEKGSSGTPGRLLASEDATAEETKVGTGLVSRSTLHTHLREEAATAMGTATSSAMIAENQQVNEKGKKNTKFYPPMEEEEEGEAEPIKRQTEQIPALFCWERRKDENNSLAQDRQYLRDGSEMTPFPSSSSAGELAAEKKQKREQTEKSLLISYWKSKHAFQLNKHGLKDPDSIHNSYNSNQNNSSMMVGGYSAPVGLDGFTSAKEHYTQFSSALPQLKEESAERTQKQQLREEEEEEKSGVHNYPRRLGEVACVDDLPSKTEIPSDRWVTDGVYTTGQGHIALGSGLGMGEVGRFSLATSVPAFFRVRSSKKKTTNQHSGIDGDTTSSEEEASMGKITKREKRNSEVFLAMSSSPSLGMTPKRTTLHAVLRDGLLADAVESISDFTEAQVENTCQRMENRRSVVVPPASASSSNQASDGRQERRSAQASEFNAEEYESGEYAT